MVEVALVIMPKLLLTVLPLDWLGVLLLPILEGAPVSRIFSLSPLFVELAVPKDIGISFATSVAVSRRFVSCDASSFPGAIMLTPTMVALNTFSIPIYTYTEYDLLGQLELERL